MIFFPSLKKKILVCVFLFLTISGLIIPKQADALLLYGIAKYAESRLTADKCGTNVEKWGPFKGFFAGAVDVVTWLPKVVAEQATSLSGATMEIKDWPITKEGSNSTTNAGAKAFQAGWTSTRDLGNMLIVLGFVVIGIGVSLRLRDYELKKALFPLIMVALFINFSGLICGLIIDASNLTMSGLIGSGGAGANMGTRFFSLLIDTENNLACTAIDNLPKYAAIKFSYGFIYFAVGTSFLLLAVLMIARYVAMGMLYMLSPLAFACYGLPFSMAKGVFQKWWSIFLKWAFVGIGTCFFLSVAGKVAESITEINPASGGATMLSLFVVLTLVVAGLYVSLKVGAVGAGAAISLAGGVGKLAAGAIAGSAGGLAGMANRLSGGRGTAAIQSVKSGYGKALERLRLRDAGSTQAANAANVKKQAESFETRYSAAKAAGDESTMSSIQRAARTGRGAYGAGALQAVTKAGHLGKTFVTGTGATAKPDWAKASAQISYAEANGAVGLRKEAVAQNYQMAGYDEKKVAEIKANNPRISDATARNKATEAELDSQIGSMDHGKLRDIDAKHLTAERVNKLTPEKISAFRTGSKAQRKQIRGISVRGTIEKERNDLEYNKHSGQRIDEGRLTKLNDRLREIKKL